jgi:NitT/TauT family transport system permease protein
MTLSRAEPSCVATETQPVADERRSRFTSAAVAQPLAMAAVAVAVLLVWQFLPGALGVPKFIIPKPTDMLVEGQRMIARENLGRHFMSTTWTAVAGFVLGSLFGAGVGYLLGMSRFWEKVLSPYILAMQIAPKVAFAPLFIMWFGYSFWPKLLTTILVVFFPILVNVVQAVRVADRDLINLARAYTMTGTQTFWKILFPLSLPALMAGLRIGATLAVIGVTVGELLGGNTGLGFLITYGEGQSNTAMVFDAIVLLTAIGIVLYGIVGVIERRVLHYV